MTRNFSILFLLLFSVYSFAQENGMPNNKEPKNIEQPKAKYEQYQIYTLEKDTILVDTSLTIKSDYKYNNLRRDHFGLLPFANEGQTYLMLDFNQKSNNPYPEIGFKAKHYNFYQPNDIKYYRVATPLTELYFRTVSEQGQNVDALLSFNTSEQFNFSIGFKGMRSLGKYINQLSSSGNFKLTSSYFTKNKRYIANFHFTGQDLFNGENGGIVNTSDFESENIDFRNRARFQVYFIDASNFLKGKRVFIDHQFRVNKKDSKNNLIINHQFNFENKFFEYMQNTKTTSVNNIEVSRFGEANVLNNIKDHLRYRKMYNQVGVSFKNDVLGNFKFFAEDYFVKQYYANDVTINSQVIPSKIQNRINAVGGQHTYSKNKFNTELFINKAFTTITFSEIRASVNYKINAKNSVTVLYENISKIPDNNFILHQSAYKNYNWYTSFKNQKTNSIKATAATQWVNLDVNISLFNDYLYFTDTSTNQDTLLVAPKQYNKTINYISFKASREFKYKKWALDNTILYQNVSQDDKIINLPQLTTRNTIYFSDYFFKRALFLQTGITANYFTKFFADDYHPLLAETFVQTKKEIGNFPMLDFFVNARIRQTRIFVKAEHFNSGFTGNKFYTAPNYPYRDFMVRFGLVWNFFQ